MASTTLTTAIRNRFSTFAGVASPFADSRRRDFVTTMLTGLVAGGHVYLTAIARANSRGSATLHAAEPSQGGATSWHALG